MSATIPESHLNLITGPVAAALTTISPEGHPENSIIWCSWDGSHVLVATEANRRKARNVATNRRVALLAMDPENPYRWIDVRGTVEEVGPDTDYALIDAHAMLYEGQETYFGGVTSAADAEGQERIIFKIRPERVVIFPANA